MKKNKKGIIISSILIILVVVASGSVIFLFLSGFVPVLVTNIGSMACASSVFFRDVTQPVGSFIPLFFCNTHKSLLKIDATKFSACPNVDKDGMTESNKNQYYANCARAQIDDLAEQCWKMAGRGNANIEGLQVQVGGPTDLWFAKPDTTIIDTETEGVLRCYKFTVVGVDISFDDDQRGCGNIYYSLDEDGNVMWNEEFIAAYEEYKVEFSGNTDDLLIPWEWAQTTDFTCSEIFSADGGVESANDMNSRSRLNYSYSGNLTTCYISFLHDKKAVERNCGSGGWNPDVGEFTWLN